MKKIYSWKWLLPAFIVMLSIVIYACNKKLNLQPQGSLIASNVNNNSGVQGLLIGAYRLLSGEDNPCQNCGNGSAASNYVYGNEAADDAYKGSTPSDQPDAIPINTWSLSQAGTSAYLDEKWTTLYNGIQRANDVIRTVRLVYRYFAGRYYRIRSRSPLFAWLFIILKARKCGIIFLMSMRVFLTQMET